MENSSKLHSTFTAYIYTVYSFAKGGNILFDVATDYETHLKSKNKHQTSPPGPAMTHVVLFVHANLPVREGFQQRHEWRHIGKLPPATVEILTSSFVDNQWHQVHPGMPKNLYIYISYLSI